MARKGKAWGPSNPLWRWRQKHPSAARKADQIMGLPLGKHRKANKSGKGHKSTVRHMARRKRSYRPRRSWFRRRFHRKDNRISILQASGLALTQFSNLGVEPIHPKGALGGLIERAQSGQDIFENISWFANDEMRIWTGYDPPTGQWNPMNARALQVMIATTLASRFLGKYVNPTIKRIPMVGRYIKL